MKTHLHPIRRHACLTLGVLALAATASVSAQTVITPDLKAPPGAYNTSSPGFVLRAHQIAAARSPGDQNSIANVLKELAGGFGPSIAADGPLPGGLWPEPYLNHSTDWVVGPADGDWVFFTAPSLPFPGVNTDTTQTGGFSTFAYEIITYLDLTAGTHTLVVGSGDSFRLTIGVGDNPLSVNAVQAGQFNGSRNYAPSVFDVNVQSAGVYPVRIIYGQGGGINGLQFYSTNQVTTERYLINDPNGGGMQLKSYQPASLPITPSLAYVSKVLPVPGDAGTSPMPLVQAQLTDGTATTVNTNTISMSFDGAPVSSTITKTGAVTYVTYNVPSLLPNLSVHTSQVVAQDSAANLLSNAWTFTVGSVQVIPASWSYPAGSGDASKPGFAGRIHQLRANAFISTSIATANAQLDGQMIDPNTGEPYINTVVTNENPILELGWSGTQPADAGGGPAESRAFSQANVVNYSILDGYGALADLGEFSSVNGKPDSLWPGLPGSNDADFMTYENAVEFAAELIGWIELPAGLQEMGVNCDDGFQLAISPNDARDIFRKDLISYERDRNATTSRVSVFVETQGVYSFRLIYRAFRNNLPNALEWFRYDPANPSQPVLINDKVVGAVKSYRSITVPTRPYVKSVTPAAGTSGVGPTESVRVVLVNLGANTPVLKVGGATVATTSVTNGNEVTLTYTPATPLSGTVDCQVTYAGAVGQWSYAVRTGRKSMLVINGSTPNASEQAIAGRLAAAHGFDVEIKDSNLFDGGDLATLSLASNKVLIVVSSTISSGNIDAWARAFVRSNLTVPIMTWEYGNVDDWAFNADGGNGNAGSGQTSVLITNAPNALTAGLTNGVYTPYVSSSGQSWMTTVPDGAIVAAVSTAGTNPRIVGIPSGLTVDSGPIGESITHASRKVYWGLIHNTGAEVLNADGWALFDAAIVWLAPPPPAPPKLTATAGPGVGQMTLSWTGSGTLETATSLAAPVWVNAPSQSNPQTVNTADAQRYYRVKQ
jgi:hypothetical protein